MYTIEELFDKRSVVGARVEAILAERAYTKARFSQITGISRPTLDKILAGCITSETNYKKHMEKVLSALTLTPDELMRDTKNLYNRTRNLRDILRVNVGELARSSGVDLSRLREIEAGGRASMAELRDIACALATSVRSILGENYFQTQVAWGEDFLYPSKIPSDFEAYGFWGHIGVRVSPEGKYFWYPITKSTCEMVQEGLEKEFVVVPCMNNKVLLLNNRNVSNVILMDEACDPSGDDDWDPSVSCGEIPLVVYEALEDYVEYAETGEKPGEDVLSPKLLKGIERFIEERGLEEEDIFSWLSDCSIYYKNGKVDWFRMDFEYGNETITEEIAQIYEFDCTQREGSFLLYEDEGERENFLNVDQISMLELPLLKVENAICRAQEEMRTVSEGMEEDF